MKIVNVDSPSMPSPSGAKATTEMSPTQRAIAKLEALSAAAAQSQTAPVLNPTSVSPEEMGAVRAPTSGQSVKEESPVSETAVEETKAAEEPLSSQYAVLARKEKALRLRDQQLKQKEAAIKAAEDASKAKPASPSFDESKYISKDVLLRDPIRVLLESGLTYEQLTEAALNGPKQEDIVTMNEIKALREELKALKGETESNKKTFEEQQTTQRTQAERQIRSDVTKLVTSGSDFETIRETNSVSDVVELITKTFDEDGILLTAEEAAQQVEDYLIEEALKISRIGKIQQRLQPKAPAAAAPAKSAGQPEQSQMKTLTNSVQSSRPLSARERALAAFERKLNNK